MTLHGYAAQKRVASIVAGATVNAHDFTDVILSHTPTKPIEGQVDNLNKVPLILQEQVVKSASLDVLYTKLAPVVSTTAASLLPLSTQPESGQFNVFSVEDLMRCYHTKPAMAFDRRAFHKISLVRGRSRVEYADQAVEVAHNALWFATSRVPYRWLPHDSAQVGYYCIFTDEFLLPVNGGTMLHQLPVFQPGECPVWEITIADYAAVEAIFQKMTREIASDFSYKYDLLRTYLLELIYVGQKLKPAPALMPIHNASARLTTSFTDLLERQFPLVIPQQQLRLHLSTATDYADQLFVHVNHLNRVLKESTGHTTTDLIGSRVAQEAKMLLRQTNWTVSEIAVGLGFADVAHFCHFFKRQTGLVPGAFRGDKGICLNLAVNTLTPTNMPSAARRTFVV